MFLADKYSSLLPSLHQHHSKPSRRRSQQLKGEADRFGAALAARLRGLLPLPASQLAALARVADLLALTLADAGDALAGAGEGDASAAAVAAHLDAGVALLDACNAIAVRLDRLRRRRLLARLALHLLSSTSSSPSGRARARAALADRGDHPAASPSPLAPLPSLPFEQPRGRLSAAARVLAAVDAVSSLAAAAAAAILVGGPASFPRVSGGGDLPWAEPFNAVSGQLAALEGAGEVGAVDEAVRSLASALDAGTDNEAAVRPAAQELERRTEELAPRLDRLSDAVGGVFRAALGLRNAELGCFMVGPAGKPCSKYP
ncbi:UPF0496 protein 4 [Sorghum bicolor]|uniref:Uncharacterized protein n=1 Tax=Sorghum bicolor TaxID=4558 RepID=C5YA66_SORBI|nr:UPF0496 protein 4 [Sorghum bicolor]EES13084.1 hypothetical protein SORBI_3006G263600 [Sorghum bicolor]|eukprot:XP_002448756.1 UPF0496 protein 4 [Sorghum bicolor]